MESSEASFTTTCQLWVHGGPWFANLHIRLMVGFLVLNCPRVDIMAVVQGARVRKEGVMLGMVEEKVQRLRFQGLGSVGKVPHYAMATVMPSFTRSTAVAVIPPRPWRSGVGDPRCRYVSRSSSTIDSAYFNASQA